MKNKLHLWILGLYLLLLIPSAMFNWMGFAKWHQLSISGHKTIGAIVSTNCHSHGEFTFEFQVGEKRFRGVGSSGVEKSCAELRAGDSVSIIYLPTDPRKNASSDSAMNLEPSMNQAVLMTLAFPAIVVVFLLILLNGIRKND
jgi:hypothetical protein